MMENLYIKRFRNDGADTIDVAAKKIGVDHLKLERHPMFTEIYEDQWNALISVKAPKKGTCQWVPTISRYADDTEPVRIVYIRAASKEEADEKVEKLLRELPIIAVTLLSISEVHNIKFEVEEGVVEEDLYVWENPDTGASSRYAIIKQGTEKEAFDSNDSGIWDNGGTTYLLKGARYKRMLKKEVPSGLKDYRFSIEYDPDQTLYTGWVFIANRSDLI